MKNILLAALLVLTACEGYRAPGTSDPAKMSGDTLCYRYAYAKTNRALKEEVVNRNLDCRAVLEEQPLIGTESRY